MKQPENTEPDPGAPCPPPRGGDAIGHAAAVVSAEALPPPLRVIHGAPDWEGGDYLVLYGDAEPIDTGQS